jgi:hypothetical protein
MVPCSQILNVDALWCCMQGSWCFAVRSVARQRELGDSAAAAAASAALISSSSSKLLHPNWLCTYMLEIQPLLPQLVLHCLSAATAAAAGTSA